MKHFYKIAIMGSILAMLSGCTGSTYNADKSCKEDYLLHPVLSVPSWIGACD